MSNTDLGSLFVKWPKIERLSNMDMVITEKIDGTNACIAFHDNGTFHVQSRNRIIEPGSDNQGFAVWAYEHADELRELLGVGYHYGEWWGRKIGRTYDMEERRFSLFNVGRWNQPFQRSPQWHEASEWGLDVVPLLLHNTLDLALIQQTFDKLMQRGSVAAPGYANPEGICVYLPRVKTYWKVTDAMQPKVKTEHDVLPDSVMDPFTGQVYVQQQQRESARG